MLTIKVQFVYLDGHPNWTSDIEYKVKQSYPDMEIIECHDQMQVTRCSRGYIRVVFTKIDIWNHYSPVYHGAVIHALSRASQGDADATTLGRPVEVSSLHNISNDWG
jgi:hypothetical protein